MSSSIEGIWTEAAKLALNGILLVGALAVAGSGMAADAGTTEPLPGSIARGLPNGTLTLAVVAHALTRDQILNGLVTAERDRIPPTDKRLLELGYSDGDIVSGSVAMVTYQAYRNNARSPIRAISGIVLAPKGTVLSDNIFIDVETQGDVDVVARVRHGDGPQGGCTVKPGERGILSILDALSPIGGARTVNLDCPGMEAEGWKRIPMGYAGGYVWRKAPSAAPSQGNPSKQGDRQETEKTPDKTQ